MGEGGLSEEERKKKEAQEAEKLANRAAAEASDPMAQEESDIEDEEEQSTEKESNQNGEEKKKPENEDDVDKAMEALMKLLEKLLAKAFGYSGDENEATPIRNMQMGNEITRYAEDIANISGSENYTITSDNAKEYASEEYKEHLKDGDIPLTQETSIHIEGLPENKPNQPRPEPTYTSKIHLDPENKKTSVQLKYGDSILINKERHGHDVSITCEVTGEMNPAQADQFAKGFSNSSTLPQEEMKNLESLTVKNTQGDTMGTYKPDDNGELARADSEVQTSFDKSSLKM